MTGFLKYQFPAIVWAAVIFYASSLHTVPTFKFFLSPDKIAHSLVFLILTGLSWRAFNHLESLPFLKQHALLMAFLVTCIYALSDEFHQRFVPGRVFDLFDLLADSFGGLVFVAGYKLYLKVRNNSAPVLPE